MAEEPGEFELDLDAFVPPPSGYVTFQKQRYPVRSLLDMPSGHALELLQLERELQGDGGLDDKIALMRRALKLRLPTLDDLVLAAMSTTDMIRVSRRAAGITKAEDPPPAAGSPASPTSTLPSAASTDGLTGS